jgi:hypothetical protein
MYGQAKPEIAAAAMGRPSTNESRGGRASPTPPPERGERQQQDDPGDESDRADHMGIEVAPGERDVGVPTPAAVATIGEGEQPIEREQNPAEHERDSGGQT